MSTYLVLHRMRRQDMDYMPGTILTNPDGAAILMQRGYLIPVPDNFTPPPATTRARASESAGSGARRPSNKEAEPPSLPGTSAVAIGTPLATPTNQDNAPLPTVKQGLEAGYSQESAEHLAHGEFGPQDEGETKALEEALDARPEILELAKATDESLSTLLKESDEGYQELVRTFLTNPGAGVEDIE